MLHQSLEHNTMVVPTLAWSSSISIVRTTFIDNLATMKAVSPLEKKIISKNESVNEIKRAGHPSYFHYSIFLLMRFDGSYFERLANSNQYFHIYYVTLRSIFISDTVNAVQNLYNSCCVLTKHECVRLKYVCWNLVQIIC